MNIFDMYNTNVVVGWAFVAFIAVLLWKKVPIILAARLDERAARIRNDLAEARRLREEAAEILSDYERKLLEVKAVSKDIVDRAKVDAEREAELARLRLDEQIKRRVESGQEQIRATELMVEREIRERAAKIAIETATRVLSEILPARDAAKFIDSTIDEIKH